MTASAKTCEVNVALTRNGASEFYSIDGDSCIAGSIIPRGGFCPRIVHALAVLRTRNEGNR